MQNDSLALFICQTTDNCNNSKWMVILIVVSTDENQFEQEATQILKKCILWCLNKLLVLPNIIGVISFFLFSSVKSSLES